MQDEFYIGWQNGLPSFIARWMKAIVIVLLCAAILLAVVVAKFQRTIGIGMFEWGTVKEFTGTFVADPHPRLLVHRPGLTGTNSAYSSYLLVKEFKFGLEPALVDRFRGKSITVKGTLIYQGNMTMLEIRADSLKEIGDQSAALASASVSLGRQTLRGEIVDSKCYLGVMNPGQFIPHRACAIRCISGGIPPLFVVRQETGPPLHLLLVLRDGIAANKEILDFVAEPLEITGIVERSGGLLIFRAGLNTIRRI